MMTAGRYQKKTAGAALTATGQTGILERSCPLCCETEAWYDKGDRQGWRNLGKHGFFLALV